MLCAAFSEWCAQLSSSIRMAAPNMAMVAGSRCSGRASTKATITTREHDERLLEQQPVLDRVAPAFIAITRASASCEALQVLAPEHVDDHRLHDHHHDDHRRQVIDEIVER